MTKYLIIFFYILNLICYAQDSTNITFLNKNFEHFTVAGSKTVFPNENQAQKYDTSFNIIPKELNYVQEYLDSFIYARHCYKFIFNDDSTKIIALFVAPFSDFDHTTFLKYNGFARNTYFPEGDSFCSYVLWGMSYNGNWFYCRDNVNTFNAKSIYDAKRIANTLLLCREMHFFKFFGTKKEDQFWIKGSDDNSKTYANGPFDLITEENSTRSEYEQEHIGEPSIVASNTYLFRRIEKKRKENNQ